MKDWLDELWEGDVWSQGSASKPVGLEQLPPALLCEYFGTSEPPSFEEPDDFAKGCAENAKMILDRYAPGETRPGRALLDILAAMGYHVETSYDLPKRRRGALDWEAGVIRLNLAPYTWDSKNTIERRIETAAHELGHLVLHEDQLRLGLLPTREMEAEADEYSRLFLLPRRLLLHDVRLRGGRPDDGPVTEMARKWCVSVGLLKERLKQVGVPASNRRARKTA